MFLQRRSNNNSIRGKNKPNGSGKRPLTKRALPADNKPKRRQLGFKMVRSFPILGARYFLLMNFILFYNENGG